MSDLKDEIKEMSENEIEKEKPYKIVNIVERFVSLIDKIKKDKDLKY